MLYIALETSRIVVPAPNRQKLYVSDTVQRTVGEVIYYVTGISSEKCTQKGSGSVPGSDQNTDDILLQLNPPAMSRARYEAGQDYRKLQATLLGKVRFTSEYSTSAIH